MRRLLLVLCVVCLVSLAGILAWQPDSRGADAAALKGLTVGAPYRHGNLAVFPVISEAPQQADRFITLDEGLESGTIEIYEIGGDGNRLGNVTLPNPAAAPAANDAGAAAAVSQQTVDVQPDAGDAAGSDNPAAENEAEAVQQLQAAATAVQSQDQSASPDQIAWNFQPGTGPEVNRLMVVNRSGKPLYLMPGEVIVGGQQDRTIAEEAILASTGEPTPIDVFCVEHGRWADRDEHEAALILSAVANPTGGDPAAESDTAVSVAVQQANSGKFVASAGVLSKASRLATQASKDQSEVWDAVSRSNAASGVAPASGAFTANYVDPDNRRRLETYIERLQPRLAGERNVVGVVVAINGKIEAVDVFESTPLFQKLWPKLLKSYALDAAVAADARHPARPPRIAAAEDFLAKALTGDVREQSRSEGGLVVQERAADGVISFTAGEGPIHSTDGDAADSAVPASAAGGFGGGVHTSALAH